MPLFNGTVMKDVSLDSEIPNLLRLSLALRVRDYCTSVEIQTVYVHF